MAQCKALLTPIGAYNSSDSNLITFDANKNKPHLPHYAFVQIQVNDDGLVIWWMVVNEGASMCVMSLTCWISTGSPILIQSSRMLKNFDGHTFRPHGIISSLLVELGEKPLRSK